jgi:hypothetical protein
MSKDNNMGKNKNMSKSDKKMVDKVNRSLNDNDDSLFSRLVGVGLIVFGALLVILAVVLVILSRKDPKVDDSFDVPSIEVSRYSDDDSATISGETDGKGKIMVWVNDELQDDLLSIEDGEFEAELDLKEEGDYEINVALLKGFIFKKRSEKSDSAMVTVDTTAPSSDVELSYDEEVEDGVVNISGEAKEGNVKVILSGDRKYAVTADKDGKFEFEGLSLEAGKNEYKVSLEDRAGNKKTLARTIVVTSAVEDTGDLNGDGVTDKNDLNTSDTGKEIPEAAGELKSALNAMMANKMLVIFGFAAVAIFSVNSAVVLKKARA